MKFPTPLNFADSPIMLRCVISDMVDLQLSRHQISDRLHYPDLGVTVQLEYFNTELFSYQLSSDK